MPLAVAPLPSLAARRAGTPSHGATTAAGSATRHGRRAGGLAVRPEEADWYAALLADHRRLYAPRDEAEASLVEQLCLVELKLARLDLLELAALDAAQSDAAQALPSLARLARYRTRIVKERWELEHRLTQLAARRHAGSGDAAATRQAVQEAARTRALGSLALLGLAQPAPRAAASASAPTPDRELGTNEPEPRAAGAEVADPTAPIPLNRHQRRRLERLRRQER